jgi:hypothetical protein
MGTSLFLAKLIGPVTLAMGLGVLANPGCYREITGEVLRSKALMVYAGLLALPAGLAIVLTHNVWTPDWRVIITLLGWLMIASGAIRIVAPQQAVAIGHSKINTPMTQKIGAAIWLAVGALLCFFGYIR